MTLNGIIKLGSVMLLLIRINMAKSPSKFLFFVRSGECAELIFISVLGICVRKLGKFRVLLRDWTDVVE